MKNILSISIAICLSACSGGGSAPAGAGGKSDQFNVNSLGGELDVLRNDGQLPDDYTIVITEASTWDPALTEGLELHAAQKISYTPLWYAQNEARWTGGDWTPWFGLSINDQGAVLDEFSYEVHGPEGALYGPVSVRVEVSPHLYVKGLDAGADDNNAGTYEEPLATLTRALELAEYGSVIMIEGNMELSEATGERLPFVIKDGVYVFSWRAIASGAGEYFSQTLQEVVTTCFVLKGERTGISGLYVHGRMRQEEQERPRVGVLLEGGSPTVAYTDVAEFEFGVLGRALDGAIFERIAVGRCRNGVDVRESLGTNTMRYSMLSLNDKFGLVLGAPNDINLGTESAPGRNHFDENYVGLVLTGGGGVQNAYGNYWNEFPLAAFDVDSDELDGPFDVFEDQLGVIDTRGGDVSGW